MACAVSASLVGWGVAQRGDEDEAIGGLWEFGSRHVYFEVAARGVLCCWWFFSSRQRL